MSYLVFYLMTIRLVFLLQTLFWALQFQSVEIKSTRRRVTKGDVVERLNESRMNELVEKVSQSIMIFLAWFANKLTSPEAFSQEGDWKINEARIYSSPLIGNCFDVAKYGSYLVRGQLVFCLCRPLFDQKCWTEQTIKIGTRDMRRSQGNYPGVRPIKICRLFFFREPSIVVQIMIT